MTSFRHSYRLLLAVIVVFGIALGGCGQKGRLYLPGKPGQEQPGQDQPPEQPSSSEP